MSTGRSKGKGKKRANNHDCEEEDLLDDYEEDQPPSSSSGSQGRALRGQGKAKVDAREEASVQVW